MKHERSPGRRPRRTFPRSLSELGNAGRGAPRLAFRRPSGAGRIWTGRTGAWTIFFSGPPIPARGRRSRRSAPWRSCSASTTLCSSRRGDGFERLRRSRERAPAGPGDQPDGRACASSSDRSSGGSAGAPRFRYCGAGCSAPRRGRPSAQKSAPSRGAPERSRSRLGNRARRVAGADSRPRPPGHRHVAAVDGD